MPVTALKGAVRATIGWCETFGVPLLLACIAMSVMSAMLRSHDAARLDTMADARARVTLAVAVSRLTRLAAWDATFLSLAPGMSSHAPRSMAAPIADLPHDEVARDASNPADASNMSRVLAVLMRAYQDETSLHWIAVVDRDGIIRGGSDATAAGTALPPSVVSRLRREEQGWSTAQAGERFIGEPIYDGFGRVVAFVVIGVDTALVRDRSDAREAQGMATTLNTGYPQEPGATDWEPGVREAQHAQEAAVLSRQSTWRLAETALLVTGALALAISIFAYWQARRQRALLRSWRVGWSRAYRHRRVLAHALGTLREREGALDVADGRIAATSTSTAASASAPLLRAGSVP